MQTYHQLSNQGSDRATAYNMSNKLIHHGNQLFAGWLDAPLASGLPVRAQLGIFDPETQTLSHLIKLGEGIDNHCGPALALAPDGRMHAVVGAHHGPFIYRYADQPADPAAWSEPQLLGPADTYPSLTVDAAGTLHLAHREQDKFWQVWYRRKLAGRPWEAPRSLVVSPVAGYNHFMQSLSLGPDGSLHVLCQYHYAESGRAIDCTGRAILHLQSDDGGENWYNEGRRCDDLPLTIDRMQAVVHHPEGNLRIGNHVVDAHNQPWFYASTPDVPSGGLWHRTAQGWEAINLAETLSTYFQRNALSQAKPHLGHGRPSALTRSADGRLHLLLAANPQGDDVPWYDPSLELFYLGFDAHGQLQQFRQLSEPDTQRAQWIPALEKWDWTRPDASCVDGAWFMFTAGQNAGGIGGNNRNAVNTRVYLGHIN